MLPEEAPCEKRVVPQLHTIYFYLSSFCNLNCRHCWIAPTYRRTDEAPAEAPIETLKDIIDQALPLGLRSIKLTGGEPFLNKNIFDLITYAFDKKLGVIIETNGTLITDGIARFLGEKKVSFISVSLDGPDQKTHEGLRARQGCFDKTIEGIRSLVKHGLNVQVIFSVYKENRTHLTETIRLAEELGAKSFKINCISGIARGIDLKDSNKLLSVKDYLALENEINKDIQPARGIKIVLDIPVAFKKIKSIKQDGTCGIKHILGILADGTVSICGIGSTTPALRFGNTRKKTLAEIWNDHPVFRELREGIPHKLEGVCARCIFKAYCLGKCRAEAYSRTGSFFSPFSFCEEADKAGLFPVKSVFIPKKTNP